jgi:conjugal transfer/entry exclusion protein
MRMSWRETDSIKLDFEDLVKELDQFEQDIQSLQSRIDQFMDQARQPGGEPIETVDMLSSEIGVMGGSS